MQFLFFWQISRVLFLLLKNPNIFGAVQICFTIFAIDDKNNFLLFETTSDFK